MQQRDRCHLVCEIDAESDIALVLDHILFMAKAKEGRIAM
jgi:hypothetical protein